MTFPSFINEETNPRNLGNFPTVIHVANSSTMILIQSISFLHCFLGMCLTIKAMHTYVCNYLIKRHIWSRKVKDSSPPTTHLHALDIFTVNCWQYVPPTLLYIPNYIYISRIMLHHATHDLLLIAVFHFNKL